MTVTDRPGLSEREKRRPPREYTVGHSGWEAENNGTLEGSFASPLPRALQALQPPARTKGLKRNMMVSRLQHGRRRCEE